MTLPPHYSFRTIAVLFLSLVLFSCGEEPAKEEQESVKEKDATSITINRDQYKNRLEGFWLGQCIANWTGLITEMDKIGKVGEFDTGEFYTREDWGTKDLPSIWGQGVPSDLSETIDFVLRGPDTTWSSDDDTDIEYIYQHLLHEHKTSILTGEQIRDGWLKHIKHEEENYLWVSNQRAFELMLNGVVPPATSLPDSNEHFEMIDAQLTTEIFGFFAPTRPDIALKMAHLPIRTSARAGAAEISEFNVIVYSLALKSDSTKTMKERVHWTASEARKHLEKDSYPAAMYDFVKEQYDANTPWETTRDQLYERFQIGQEAGYNFNTQEGLYCNGCFAAGINYGASVISLLYGEGNIKETIKIGTLCGWDSDNPTATWGGLLGYMLGMDQLEKVFDQELSHQYNIHHTRVNFDNGIDTFENMAEKGVEIVDRVVLEEMGGSIDSTSNSWVIPIK